MSFFNNNSSGENGKIQPTDNFFNQIYRIPAHSPYAPLQNNNPFTTYSSNKNLDSSITLQHDATPTQFYVAIPRQTLPNSTFYNQTPSFTPNAQANNEPKLSEYINLEGVDLNNIFNKQSTQPAQSSSINTHRTSRCEH
mgnify:FL=1